MTHLLLAAPGRDVDRFAPLVDAYRANDVDVEILSYADRMPDWDTLVASAANRDAVLLAGPGQFAPRTALRAPFLDARNGRRVPVGWCPLKDRESTDRFVRTAARVQQRARDRRTVAVLGQWHPRYLHLADRIQTLLAGRTRTFRWTGEVIARDGLVRALGSGLGLGIYVGHGRAVGWVGYAGTRAGHFDDFRGEPLGGVVSLCCRTASRRRVGISYAEALPLKGVAAASLGAVTETRHTDNTRWAVRLCEVLASHVDTIGELVVRSAPPNASAFLPYRIIGDPLAPLAAERAGERRARAVPTYP